jgi:hypothetical protein
MGGASFSFTLLWVGDLIHMISARWGGKEDVGRMAFRQRTQSGCGS